MAFFRKNFSYGVLAVALKSAPDYPDDPGYDELAVEVDHTLPNEDDTDLTTEFRLVVWSGTVNPGDDPSMEIVTVTRTVNSRVYQITERGSEGTGIVEHPVGSYVGLHYTAGVSNDDIAPIEAILDSSAGSVFYTWITVTGEKIIKALAPGSYGQVLVTAGPSAPPFWDWIFRAPGAAYSGTKTIGIYIVATITSETITLADTHTQDTSGHLYMEYDAVIES